MVESMSASCARDVIGNMDPNDTLPANVPALNPCDVPPPIPKRTMHCAEI